MYDVTAFAIIFRHDSEALLERLQIAIVNL